MCFGYGHSTESGSCDLYVGRPASYVNALAAIRLDPWTNIKWVDVESNETVHAAIDGVNSDVLNDKVCLAKTLTTPTLTLTTIPTTSPLILTTSPPVAVTTSPLILTTSPPVAVTTSFVPTTPVPTSSAARVVLTATVAATPGTPCTQSFATGFVASFLDVLNQSTKIDFPDRSRLTGIAGTCTTATPAAPTARRRLLQAADDKWVIEVVFNVTEVSDEAEIVPTLAREIREHLSSSEAIDVVVGGKVYVTSAEVTSTTRSGLHRHDDDDEPAWIEKDLSILLVTAVGVCAVVTMVIAVIKCRARYGMHTNSPAYVQVRFDY